jgi:PUA-domain protein
MKKAMKNKEVKEILSEIFSLYRIELSKKSKFEQDDEIILIDNEPKFFLYEKKIYPVLKTILENNVINEIVVDMGAVPYAAKGADMMRPGITEIPLDLKKNDVVAIVDEKHRKPIAIGISLFSYEELKEMKSGRAVKNIHYVGDEIWNYN